MQTICSTNKEYFSLTGKHVCGVLKSFVVEMYKYPELPWTNKILSYLDYVLICNQHITNQLTDILKWETNTFYQDYPKGLFPQFLREYPQDIIRDNIDRINDEIDNIQPGEPPVFEFTDKVRDDLLDLRVPYKAIVQIAKQSRNEPTFGAKVLEYAEYGYYIGSLLNITISQYQEKYNPDSTIWTEPFWDILRSRIKTFRPTVLKNIKKDNNG